MHLERLDYGAFALQGFEPKVREIFGRRHFLGIVCHKGERRAPTAERMLTATGYPVANTPHVVPTLNYEDLIDVKFVVTHEGLIVPGKTDVPFANLIVFHDGSVEEEKALRQIKNRLDVEADGVLEKLVFAYVRDEEGLLSIG